MADINTDGLVGATKKYQGSQEALKFIGALGQLANVAKGSSGTSNALANSESRLWAQKNGGKVKAEIATMESIEGDLHANSAYSRLLEEAGPDESKQIALNNYFAPILGNSAAQKETTMQSNIAHGYADTFIENSKVVGRVPTVGEFKTFINNAHNLSGVGRGILAQTVLLDLRKSQAKGYEDIAFNISTAEHKVVALRQAYADIKALDSYEAGLADYYTDPKAFGTKSPVLGQQLTSAGTKVKASKSSLDTFMSKMADSLIAQLEGKVAGQVTKDRDGNIVPQTEVGKVSSYYNIDNVNFDMKDIEFLLDVTGGDTTEKKTKAATLFKNIQKGDAARTSVLTVNVDGNGTASEVIANTKADGVDTNAISEMATSSLGMNIDGQMFNKANNNIKHMTPEHIKAYGNKVYNDIMTPSGDTPEQQNMSIANKISVFVSKLHEPGSMSVYKQLLPQDRIGELILINSLYATGNVNSVAEVKKNIKDASARKFQGKLDFTLIDDITDQEARTEATQFLTYVSQIASEGEISGIMEQYVDVYEDRNREIAGITTRNFSGKDISETTEKHFEGVLEVLENNNLLDPKDASLKIAGDTMYLQSKTSETKHSFNVTAMNKTFRMLDMLKSSTVEKSDLGEMLLTLGDAFNTVFTGKRASKMESSVKFDEQLRAKASDVSGQLAKLTEDQREDVYDSISNMILTHYTTTGKNLLHNIEGRTPNEMMVSYVYSAVGAITNQRK